MIEFFDGGYVTKLDNGFTKVVYDNGTCVLALDAGPVKKHAEDEKHHDDKWVTIDGRRVLIDDPNDPRYQREKPEPSGQAQAPAFRLLQALKRNGGFTYGVTDRNTPKDGFILSIFPQHSAVFDRSEINAAKIREYAVKHADVLRDPKNYLGGWYDRNSGKIFLDISTRVTSHDEARALSEQHRQRAYWSLHEGKEYRVVDESKAHDSSIKPRFAMVKGVDPSDDDIDAFLRALLNDE